MDTIGTRILVLISEVSEVFFFFFFFFSMKVYAKKARDTR